MSTPKRAKPFPGPALYQQRAAVALPLLVRQAWRGKEITYGDLARMMGMPNARNLNFVLGSVGNTLIKLGRKWGVKIPPIQAITVNAQTRLPGKGGQLFVGGKKLLNENPHLKRRVIETAFGEIFAYQDWSKVLKELQLIPPTPQLDNLLKRAANLRGSGGESAAHNKFKERLAKNPGLLGIKGHLSGSMEHPIPSGDRIDIVFESAREIVAVEVKSRISSEADIARGLFQCLKYRVVLEAQVAIERSRKRVRVILALEDQLAAAHLEIKAALGVDVIEFGAPAK